MGKHKTEADRDAELWGIKYMQSHGFSLVKDYDDEPNEWDADMHTWDAFKRQWAPIVRVEFKRRHHRFGKFDTIVFEKRKADIMAAQKPGTAIYVAMFDDVVRFTWITQKNLARYEVKQEFAVRQHEQAERQDPLDKDRTVYLIPLLWFHPVIW